LKKISACGCEKVEWWRRLRSEAGSSSGKHWGLMGCVKERRSKKKILWSISWLCHFELLGFLNSTFQLWGHLYWGS
jgi:hypothetical protein